MAMSSGGPARIDVQAFLEEVHARISLVDLAGEVVRLKRVGRSFRGACPFHDATNRDNFDVSPTRNLYYCFVCGRGGTAIQFVRDHPAFAARSFLDAVRYLAERASIPVPLAPGLDAAVEARAHRLREVVSQALEFARNFYHFAGVSDKYGPAMQAQADALGIDASLLTRGDAGFVPAPEMGALLKSIRHYELDADFWDAFRRLGLLAFDGSASSEQAARTVRDALPCGLVWPVWRGTQLVGLTVRSTLGTVLATTGPVGACNPNAGLMRVQPAPEVLTHDPKPWTAVFASFDDWCRQGGAVLQAGVVPLGPWDETVAADRMRRTVGERDVAGILGQDGSDMFWLHPTRLAWMRRIAAPGAPWATMRHPCEHARALDPDLDLLHIIHLVPDAWSQVLLEGWWHRETKTPVVESSDRESPMERAR